MKVRSVIIRLTCKALYESLGMDLIVRIARIIFPNYNLNERTGIQEAIPITAQMAAEQIVRDMIETGRFYHFIELLISINDQGLMGREYPISHLREIVKEIIADGYIFDEETGLFVENSSCRISPDWGRLLEGEERNLALLRLDIAQNSLLVKNNPKEAVDSAYESLRLIISHSVLMRSGRVWIWEGDGCLCGFLFGRKERAAVFASMEILHELFLYNRLHNPLSSPLQVRVAVHAGPLRYSTNPDLLRKNETVKEITEIESMCAPVDGLAVSSHLFISLDRTLQERFKNEVAYDGLKARQYSIAVEKL
ncbi:hypothetical protein MASR2M78_25070 [Treponema sp.]